MSDIDFDMLAGDQQEWTPSQDVHTLRNGIDVPEPSMNQLNAAVPMKPPGSVRIPRPVVGPLTDRPGMSKRGGGIPGLPSTGVDFDMIAQDQGVDFDALAQEHDAPAAPAPAPDMADWKPGIAAQYPGGQQATSVQEPGVLSKAWDATKGFLSEQMQKGRDLDNQTTFESAATTLGKGVQLGQEHVGKHVAGAVLEELGGRQPVGSLQFNATLSPKDELTARGFLSFVGGPSIQNGMDPLREAQGANDLEGSLGTYGAAYARSLAVQAGQLPLFLIRAPAATQVGLEAKAIASAIKQPVMRSIAEAALTAPTSAVEFGMQGAAEAASKGDDAGAAFSESMKSGAVLGPVLHGAGQVLGAGRRVFKGVVDKFKERPVAILDPLASHPLAVEMAEDIAQAPLQLTDVAEPTKKFTDTAIRARMNEEPTNTDLPVTKASKPGAVSRPKAKTQEFLPEPVDTSAHQRAAMDAALAPVRAVVVPHDTPNFHVSATGLVMENGKPTGVAVEMKADGQKRYKVYPLESKADAYKFGQVQTKAGHPNMAVDNTALMALPGEYNVALSGFRRKKGMEDLVTPDLPPDSLVPEPAVVHVREDGNLSLKDVPKPTSAETPVAKGDRVQVHDRAGSKLARVMDVGPNNTAIVRVDGERGQQSVEGTQVTKVPDLPAPSKTDTSYPVAAPGDIVRARTPDTHDKVGDLYRVVGSGQNINGTYVLEGIGRRNQGTRRIVDRADITGVNTTQPPSGVSPRALRASHAATGEMPLPEPIPGTGGAGGPRFPGGKEPIPAPATVTDAPAVDAPSAHAGEKVYVGQAKGLNTRVGTVKGPDPTTPGNFLVEIGIGNTARVKSLHPNQFSWELPPNIARIDDILPEPVEGMPQMTPGAMHPQLVENSQQSVELLKYMSKEPGRLEKMGISMQNVYWRAPREMQHLIAQAQSVKALNNPDEMAKALRKSVGLTTSQLEGLVDKDLGKVFAGSMSSTDFLAKHNISLAQNPVFRGMAEEIHQLNTLYKQLTGTQGLSGADVDNYLARVYYAYLFPKGVWAKMVPAERMEDAVNALASHLQNAGEQYSRTALSDKVRELLNSDDPAAAWMNSTLSKSKAFNNLKARNQLPDWFSQLLGPVESGVLRASLTIAGQRSAIRNMQTFNELAGWKVVDQLGRDINPYWSRGRRADLPVQVPDLPEYGNARGGWTTREWGEIINAPKRASNTEGFWHMLGGVFKGNVVLFGGPATWMNNFMRSVKPAIAAGSMPLINPGKFGERFVQAASAMKSWKQNPTAGNTGGNIILEMRRLGVGSGGQGAHEIAGPLSYVADAVHDHFAGAKNQDFFQMMAAAPAALHRKIGNGRREVGEAYDQTDQLWKTATYIDRRAAHLEDGMPVEQAAREAARLVRRYWPDFANVAPVVEKMRNGSPLSVAPFLSGIAEETRSSAMIAKDAATNPAMAARIAAQAAVIGSVGFGLMPMLRRMNGISDAEVEASLKGRTDRAKTYKPLVFTMPFRDPWNKKLIHVDPSSWITELQLFQGNPNNSMAQNVATNLALSPVQGSVIDQPIRGLMEQYGIHAAGGTPRQLLPGEGTLMNGINAFAEGGGVPGVIPRGLEISRQAGAGEALRPYTQNSPLLDQARRTFIGDQGRNSETLSLGAALAKSVLPIAGEVTVPDSRTSSPTQRGQQAENAARLKELQKQLYTIGHMKESPEKHRLREAAIEEYKRMATQRGTNAQLWNAARSGK